ncbi:MAG: ribonuclease H-like domain-containing protein [Spirochaetota bacterium]|nr:ribonuclease H-like domain-containing protein [Spirochaetota bacterium]
MTLAEKLALLSHCNGGRDKSNNAAKPEASSVLRRENEHDRSGPANAGYRALPSSILEAPLAREYTVRPDEGATDTALAEIMALPEQYWRCLLEAIHPRAVYMKGLPGLLFFDLETTGLGGAGCYAFLTGALCFVDGKFIIKQFFLPHPALEREYLNAVEDYFSTFGAVVSYNGLRFDAPLLAMRAARQKKKPFLPASHYDLLYGARAFWSEHYENCRLKTLEREVCSFARSADDIDGSKIPDIYIQWLHDGNAAPLEPVFEHNRADLIALLHLAANMAVIIADTHAPRLSAGNWAPPTIQSLIWLAERARKAGDETRARTLLQKAVMLPGTENARIRSALLLTRLLRKSGEYQNAADILEELHTQGIYTAMSLITLAWIYERYLNDAAKAYAFYTECRKIPEHHAATRQYLGKRCARALARVGAKLHP